MSPYFDGYLNQFGSFERNGKQVKTQYYFVLKPMETYVAYDAMVQGKRENENSYRFKFSMNEPTKNIQHLFQIYNSERLLRTEILHSPYANIYKRIQKRSL